MVQTKTRFQSLEEYLRFDDGTDDRYELVDGVLVKMPTENPLNTQIAVFLITVFFQLGIPIRRLGIKHQIAVKSDSVTAREPDLMVHSEGSINAIVGATQSLISLDMPAPSLVVEVVSPGDPGSENYDRDYIQKPQEYAARGIPEYWLIDPIRAVILIHHLSHGKYQVKLFRGVEQIESLAFRLPQLTAEQILKAGE